MTSTLTTDVILRKLSYEYHNSKAEQIRRFLLDQDNLTRTFSVYAPSSGGSEDGGTESTDSGATEMVFEERMSAYKVRPQSAYPDTSRLTLDDADAGDKSSESKDAHTDGKRTMVHSRQPSRRTACDNTHGEDTPRRRQLAPDRHDAYTDGRKLLMRRAISRPRTATGVRTSGGKTESGPLRDLRVEGTAPHGTEMAKQERKQRSSAPAKLSRARLVPVNIGDVEQRGTRDTNTGFGLPSCVPHGVTTTDSMDPCHIACHTSRRSKQTSTPESDMLVVGSATARPVGRVWHPVTSRNPSRQLHRLHVPKDVSGFGTSSMGQVAVLKLPPLETVGVTHQSVNRQKTVVKSGAKPSVPTPHQFLAG